MTKKLLLFIIISFLSSINSKAQSTQKLLKQKISIAIDSTFDVQEFEGNEGLAERFTRLTAEGLDSLQKRYGYEFYDNYRQPDKKASDLLIKGKISYDFYSGYPKPVKVYMVFIEIFDRYDDLRVNYVGWMHEKLEGFFNKGQDETEIYKWVLKEIPICINLRPVETILDPTLNKGNIARSIALLRDNHKSGSDISKGILDTLYHIMNNIIAFKQQEYSNKNGQIRYLFEYDYYPNYRTKKDQQAEAMISSTLEEYDENNYRFKLHIQGNDLILIFYNEPIETEFYFSKKRLQNGDYLEAILGLYRSLSAFIFYNYRS